MEKKDAELNEQMDTANEKQAEEADCPSMDWFVCGLCKQVFRQKIQLNEHKLVFHLKKKPSSKGKKTNNFSSPSSSSSTSTFTPAADQSENQVQLQLPTASPTPTPAPIPTPNAVPNQLILSHSSVNTSPNFSPIIDTAEIPASETETRSLNNHSNVMLISPDCQTENENVNARPLLIAHPIQFLNSNGQPGGSENSQVLYTLSSSSLSSSIIYSPQKSKQQINISPINPFTWQPNTNNLQNDLGHQNNSVKDPLSNQNTNIIITSVRSIFTSSQNENSTEFPSELDSGSGSISHHLAVDLDENKKECKEGRVQVDEDDDDTDENVGVVFESICVPENPDADDVKPEIHNEEMEIIADPSGDPARPFKCSYLNCPRRFPNRHALKRHFLIHKAKRPFRCDVSGCPMKFKRRDHVLAHMRRVHLPKPPETTTIDNNNSQQQQQHSKSQSQPSNLPSTTASNSNSSSNSTSKSNSNPPPNPATSLNLTLNQNSNSMPHESDNFPFICKIPHCEMSFPTQKSLNGHMQVHKRRGWYRNPTPPPQEEQIQENLPLQPEAEASLPQISNKDMELFIGQDDEIDVKPEDLNFPTDCKSILPETESVINQIEPIQEPLPITAILPTTITTTTTIHHNSNNNNTSGGTLIITPSTTNNSNSNSTTDQEQQSSNSSAAGIGGVRSFKECHICEKILKTQKTLQGHLKLHRVSRFVCPHCRKTFTEKSYLNKHVRIHRNNPDPNANAVNFVQ